MASRLPRALLKVHEGTLPRGERSLNFARDVVDAAPAQRLALIELARDGTRREWTFGEVADELGT